MRIGRLHRVLNMSPDQAIAFAKMALAEAGYPEVEPYWEGTYIREIPVIGLPGAPLAVSWQIGTLVCPAEMACWTCYLSADTDSQALCSEGDCRHPEGPARPPRELLMRP
jgi:hypothetical protein